MKFILILLLLFKCFIFIQSVKLKIFNEDLLIKNFISSVKDSRQKRLFIDKINKKNQNEKDSNQRKKIFSEEVFFEDYWSQMNEYTVYTKKSKDFQNFRYLTYDEIVERINALSKKFPDLMELTTSQKLYNLDHPVGDCGGKLCENHIVFLGNKQKFKNETAQMYISCALHGDEKVGPTLCTEFLTLVLENYSKNKWIKFLLDNRRVILTPMTNSYGYYLGIREEITTSTGSQENDTDFHIDPNRDFPIFKRKNECMLTITARTINEIFINNLIRFSLSIHGGTSSLTYAWGTLNHLTHLLTKFKLPYEKNKNNSTNVDEIIESYYSGKFDDIDNESYLSPDDSGLNSISKILSIFSNFNPDFQYKTGTMNDLVYPTRGAFEDWAYSSSWENQPIITQPCIPNTYTHYPEFKTEYSKNYPDAIKSMSFLLETSESKSPPEVNLGLNRAECITNILRNPFKPEIDNFIEKECLSNTYNGYISKNLRLLLVNLDLLQPYVHVSYAIVRRNKFSLKWIVGGCEKVDETFVVYQIAKEGDREFENKIEEWKNEGFKNIQEIRKNNSDKLNDEKIKFSKIQSGSGIWDLNSNSKNGSKFIFEEFHDIDINIDIKSNEEKSVRLIKYVVLAKVDDHWKESKEKNVNVNSSYLEDHDNEGKSLSTPTTSNGSKKIDPEIPPQTHLINERVNPDYYAKNNNFVIKGRLYFQSEVKYKVIK
jgi:hypothetical protein